ncbi:AMIN domain-containing protein [Halomicronema sp. CCY15110]|uniref:AMIN domain-containing protein n=1 Tax=Halomicronema sp. CCY15110 TaxID=2767773 RepID=UPI00281634FB|nr:AMIN domain-containing protein [Halomicronema sp. CCY15110]
MKRLLGYGSCLASTTLLAIAAQPVMAASTMITGVEIVPTDGGAQIVLATADGDTPQVFAVNQGNTLRADIVRTQLQLPEGDRFVQQNPVPGITEIALVPLDGNSVRLMVSGSGSAPTSVVGTSASGGVIIDVATNGSSPAPQASTPVPTELETVPSDEPVLIPVEQPETVAQAETEAPAEAATPAAPQPDVLVPNPQVVIDGVPVDAPRVQTAPPFLPQAVAPPVGDIAVAESTPQFDSVDLGTTERVPRLVLRDAPSREVLNLLARAAGLNLVFIGAGGEGDGASAGSGEGPSITLDIENESVQDVFNSVLRVTGLQANRVGRTIYVGPQLPDSARSLVSRTLRLNQVAASTAAGFLVSLGAEGTQVITQTTFTDVGAGLGTAEAAETGGEGGGGNLESTLRLVERATSTEVTALDFEPAEGNGTPQILRGLLAVVDERTNSITLVGEPRIVQSATDYLARLDLRRRQVAVNVKVIDVNLGALDAFGTSFSFQLGDVGLTNSGGVGVVNFGDSTPFGTSNFPSSAPISPVGPGASNQFSVGEDFLFQLFATVQEGNSKILTDPTLIIQEGQTASVALTEQVIQKVTQEEVGDGDTPQILLDPELVDAGLVLSVNIDRIDDNGFVSLTVSPSLTAPTGVIDVGPNQFVTTLSARELQSGLVRVRDGQTLVLSGIIQETDRTSVSKVPILGDLPLLGALFRSTVNQTERNELIVLLTPEILDDSDQSMFGYSYTPSDEVQEIIERSQQR